MRRAARVGEDGKLRCRNCGSEAFLAKSNEHHKRTRRLKCAECGEGQRYRVQKPARLQNK